MDSRIQEQINRINTALTACYNAIAAKGGTVPSTKNTANLASAIATIPSNSATFNVTSDTSGATVWAEQGSKTKYATASGTTYTIGGIDEYDGWTVKGTTAGSTVTLNSVTVEEAKTYNVDGTFYATATAASNNTSYGTATVNDTNQVTVLKGTSVSLKATPADGYSFSEWSDGGSQNHNATVTATTTYTATFTKNCLVAGTLINLPDGTKKPIEELVNWDDISVWDFETGQVVTTKVTPVDKNIIPQEYSVIYLNFSDGKRIGYATEHWFFSKDAMEFVEFNENNAEDYIGQEFVKVTEDGTWTTNVLESVERVREVTTVYSPVSFKHMSFIVDDMLNMAADLKGLFNYFEVNPETMAWDADKKATDIEKYGLMTVDDFDGQLGQDAMEAFSLENLKVSMGKGLLDWEMIQYYIDLYLPNLYMNEANEEAPISEQVRDTDMDSEVEQVEIIEEENSTVQDVEEVEVIEN